jgi:hypothetical protein
MRHTSWSEDRVASFQLVALNADFDDVFAGEAVEPLVFFEMKVHRRAAFPAARLLGEKESASRVLRRDLDEQQAAIGEFQSPPESSFAGRNLDSSAGEIGRRLLRQDAGRKRRHAPEKRSTPNRLVGHGFILLQALTTGN